MRKVLDALNNRDINHIDILFISVQIILCNLRNRYSIEEDSTISSFNSELHKNLEEFSKLIQDHENIKNMKLCFILSFYQLIEEFKFENERIDLSKNYNENLDDLKRRNLDDFYNITKSNKQLYPSSNNILNIIISFTLRILYKRIIKVEDSLKIYFKNLDLWDEKFTRFIEYFPEEIKVSNTISAFDHLKKLICDEESVNKYKVNLLDQRRKKINRNQDII